MMMMMMTLSSLVPALLLATVSLGAPHPSSSSRRSSTAPGTSIPLTRVRRTGLSSNEDRLEWLRNQADALRAKYGSETEQAKVHAREDKAKRANTGTESLTNRNADLLYYGSVDVGTPAQSFDVILDTGSADLWIAGSNCQTGCSLVATKFDSSKSTTFKSSSNTIDIKYGSGEAAGSVANDTVTLGGFTVQNQGFAVMTDLSANILQGTLSGIMGLGWQRLAESTAIPWWQALATQSGTWAQPLFGFYLTRYANDADAQVLEPGGSMDIGYTNTSFGDINYVNLNAETYWLVPLDSLNIQGSEVKSGGGAAIDTGTSLIGGPSSMLSELYSHIPNAQQGTGSTEGYYVYPCTTEVNVALTFGGKSYSIDPVDFSIPVDITGETCAGAFFGLDLSSSSGVQWIVGDAFLKNVYSVFRASPPSVGFAVVPSGNSTSTTSASSSSSSTSSSSSSTSTSSTTTSSSIASTSSATRIVSAITSTYSVFAPASSTATQSSGSSSGAAASVRPVDLQSTSLIALSAIGCALFGGAMLF